MDIYADIRPGEVSPRAFTVGLTETKQGTVPTFKEKDGLKAWHAVAAIAAASVGLVFLSKWVSENVDGHL